MQKKIHLKRKRAINPREKSVAVEADWMPLRAEWDFRSIKEPECRFACLWEYVRSYGGSSPTLAVDLLHLVKGEAGNKGKRAGLKTGNCLCLRAQDLVHPYTVISETVYKELSVEDFKDLPGFVAKLRKRQDRVSAFLWKGFSKPTRKQLLQCPDGAIPDAPAQQSLIGDLNRIIAKKGVYHPWRFAGVPLEEGTRLMQREVREELLMDETPANTMRYNRWLLEEAYPEEIHQRQRWNPLPWQAFDAFSRVTSLRDMARTRKVMKKRISDDHPADGVIDRYLGKFNFALWINFKRGSVRKIMEELRKWVGKEAKRHGPPRVGKATMPPKDCLKWLAAYRLESARKESNVTFNCLRARLDDHRKKHPMTDAIVELPTYGSQMSWIKAVNKAGELLDLLRKDPVAFETRILY